MNPKGWIERQQQIINPMEGAAHDVHTALESAIDKYDLTIPETLMLLRKLTSGMMNEAMKHIGDSEVVSYNIPQQPQQPS